MAASMHIPVIQKAVWTQCENSGCEKWRKLPPGTVVDEDAPWYCYMNPDPQHNTCEAPEEHYDDGNEIVIADDSAPEEAARNQQLVQQLEASIAAAAAAAAAARGRGRGRGRAGGRGGGRGRGRPPLGGGRFGGRGTSAPFPPLYDPGAGFKRPRNVSFAEEWEEPTEQDSQGGGRPGPRLGRKQVAKALQRLLENQGSWEGVKGRAPAPALPSALPADAWDALGQAAPDAADLACTAADLASSLKYFEAGSAATAAGDEGGAVARLALMLAAATGLAGVDDALTAAERERAGLESTEPLPDAMAPLELPAAAHEPLVAQIEQQQQQHEQQQQQDYPAAEATAMAANGVAGGALIAELPALPVGAAAAPHLVT